MELREGPASDDASGGSSDDEFDASSEDGSDHVSDGERADPAE